MFIMSTASSRGTGDVGEGGMGSAEGEESSSKPMDADASK